MNCKKVYCLFVSYFHACNYDKGEVKQDLFSKFDAMIINIISTINERIGNDASNPLSAAHLKSSKPAPIIITPFNAMIFTQ